MSKLRELFERNILPEVLNCVMDETIKLYIDKLGNTPFLGSDLVGQNIYSLKENEAECLEVIYKLIDPQNEKMAPKINMLPVFLAGQKLKFAYNKELLDDSQINDPKNI